MIASRMITAEDFRRAVEINDTIANEFGGGRASAQRVGKDLGCDVEGMIKVAVEFAAERVDDVEARKTVALAVMLGALGALRSVRMIELEST